MKEEDKCEHTVGYEDLGYEGHWEVTITEYIEDQTGMDLDYFEYCPRCGVKL